MSVALREANRNRIISSSHHIIISSTQIWSILQKARRCRCCFAPLPHALSPACSTRPHGGPRSHAVPAHFEFSVLSCNLFNITEGTERTVLRMVHGGSISHSGCRSPPLLCANLPSWVIPIFCLAAVCLNNGGRFNVLALFNRNPNHKCIAFPARLMSWHSIHRRDCPSPSRDINSTVNLQERQ